jgi:hypothetical protein
MLTMSQPELHKRIIRRSVKHSSTKVHSERQHPKLSAECKVAMQTRTWLSHMRRCLLSSSHSPAASAATAAFTAMSTFHAPQARGLKWGTWGSSAAETNPEAPLDNETIEQIVALAGPATMDAATWPMVHAGTWYHTYAAELLLQQVHDLTGLSWIAVIPLTVIITRTALLPMFIQMQVTQHFMATCKPKLDMLQKQMMTSMEKGVSSADAVVCTSSSPILLHISLHIVRGHSNTVWCVRNIFREPTNGWLVPRYEQISMCSRFHSCVYSRSQVAALRSVGLQETHAFAEAKFLGSSLWSTSAACVCFRMKRRLMQQETCCQPLRPPVCPQSCQPGMDIGASSCYMQYDQCRCIE